MNLNKVSVLDNGYVCLLSSCNNSSRLREIKEDFQPGWLGTYPDFSRATLVIKCPLFFQLVLSKTNLKIYNTKMLEMGSKAFKPDPSWIQSGSNEIDCAISDDIVRTTDALMINPKAYIADGCNEYIAHMIMPVNEYTTLLVEGSANDWFELEQLQYKDPNPSNQYIKTILDIIRTEWYEKP